VHNEPSARIVGSRLRDDYLRLEDGRGNRRDDPNPTTDEVAGGLAARTRRALAIVGVPTAEVNNERLQTFEKEPK
jgi:hypothetical protein